MALQRYAKEGFRYSEGLAAPGLVSALVMTWFTLVLSFFLALPLLHPILRLFGNRPRQGELQQLGTLHSRDSSGMELGFAWRTVGWPALYTSLMAMNFT